jgi:hypothetical protein
MLSFENSFEQIARFYFRNVSIQVFVGVVSIVTVFACSYFPRHLTSFDLRYPEHLFVKLRSPEVLSHGGLSYSLSSSHTKRRQIWMIIEILTFASDSLFSTLLALSPVRLIFFNLLSLFSKIGYLLSLSGISDIVSLFFSVSFFFLPFQVFVALGFFRSSSSYIKYITPITLVLDVFES